MIFNEYNQLPIYHLCNRWRALLFNVKNTKGSEWFRNIKREKGSKSWNSYESLFAARFSNDDAENCIKAQIKDRVHGFKETMENYLKFLRALIGKLKNELPMIEQPDHAYDGLDIRLMCRADFW